MSEAVTPGTYQHYKGGLYEVLMLAQMSESSAEIVVVYRSHATGDTWVRPLRTMGADSWEDQVVWPDGVTRPRFVRRSGRVYRLNYGFDSTERHGGEP